MWGDHTEQERGKVLLARQVAPKYDVTACYRNVLRVQHSCETG